MARTRDGPGLFMRCEQMWAGIVPPVVVPCGMFIFPLSASSAPLREPILHAEAQRVCSRIKAACVAIAARDPLVNIIRAGADRDLVHPPPP
jgi:hypothetical protein